MLSLNNICPHTQVAKDLLQTCPQDTAKLLASTNSNYGEYPHDFLCFFKLTKFETVHNAIQTIQQSHIFKMFHKTIHNSWNLFKRSKQLS